MKAKRIKKEYSPRKRRTNNVEENSVLNPLTNSDSPSVKSKGARFVSAKIAINIMGKLTKKVPHPPKRGYNLIPLNDNW